MLSEPGLQCGVQTTVGGVDKFHTIKVVATCSLLVVMVLVVVMSMVRIVVKMVRAGHRIRVVRLIVVRSIVVVIIGVVVVIFTIARRVVIGLIVVRMVVGVAFEWLCERRRIWMISLIEDSAVVVVIMRVVGVSMGVVAVMTTMTWVIIMVIVVVCVIWIPMVWPSVARRITVIRAVVVIMGVVVMTTSV